MRKGYAIWMLPDGGLWDNGEMYPIQEDDLGNGAKQLYVMSKIGWRKQNTTIWDNPSVWIVIKTPLNDQVYWHLI